MVVSLNYCYYSVLLNLPLFINTYFLYYFILKFVSVYIQNIYKMINIF